MIVLKGLLTELYKNTSIQAKILGPGGFFDQKWFAEFLATTGPNVVDAVTHHVYNLGAGQRVHVHAVLVFNSYISI